MKHPGTVFKRNCLDSIGIDYERAANIMDVDWKYLKKVLEGKEPITKNLARRMENDFGGFAHTWLQMQREYDETTNKSKRV